MWYERPDASAGAPCTAARYSRAAVRQSPAAYAFSACAKRTSSTSLPPLYEPGPDTIFTERTTVPVVTAATTSIPFTTCPNTVYFRSRPGSGRSAM
jgi:hypothetical protein